MRKKYLSAAMVAAGFLALPIGAAYADEVSDLKSEAKSLQQQNEALAKRLAAIEKRQKAIEADTAATQRVMNAHAADMPMPMKAAAPVDDALCYKGICLYGIIDAGFGWQSHGQPFNGAFGPGTNYLVSPGSNRALWTAAPNGLSASTIGLKGTTEILPGLNAIFKVETAFNPESGQLANGQLPEAQNSGVPLNLRTANGDSSRNGQAFNGQVYVGLSSPTYGTLTIGRNNSLTLDQILGYDPMGGSFAFSPLGFSGTWVGGGSTENARLDQSIKYTWAYGPVHAGVIYEVGNYGSSDTTQWVHDELEGNIGFVYNGFSIDATGGKIHGLLSANPLTAGTVTPALANAGTLNTTVSDNTDFMVTAKYKWGAFEVMGGYEHLVFADPDNPVAAGFVNNFGFTSSVVTNNAFNAGDKVLQMMWIGGKWQATDHLTLIAAWYHEIQNSFGSGTAFGLPVAGCSTTISADCSGTLDAISFVADYVFTKHFDMYFGVMYSQETNGLASGSVQASVLNSVGAAAGPNGHSIASNIDPTVGFRYSF
jgi:predicted porin